MLRYAVVGESATVIRYALTALSQGDIERYVSFFQPEAELHAHFGPPLPFGGRISGHADLQQHYYMRNRLTPIRNLRWIITLMCEENIVLYGVSEYGHPGGQTVDATAAVWFTVRNGAIVEAHSYMDTSALSSVLSSTNIHYPGVQGGLAESVRRALSDSGELSGPPHEDFSPILNVYAPGRELRRSALTEFLDPEVYWFSPSVRCLDVGNSSHGADRAAEQFEAFDSAFETLAITTDQVIQAEDTMAIRARMRIRCRECLKELEIPAFQALTMRDGRIVRGFECSDTLKIDQCLATIRSPI